MSLFIVLNRIKISNELLTNSIGILTTLEINCHIEG